MVFNKDILDDDPTGYHILHVESRGNPFPLELYN